MRFDFSPHDPIVFWPADGGTPRFGRVALAGRWPANGIVIVGTPEHPRVETARRVAPVHRFALSFDGHWSEWSTEEEALEYAKSAEAFGVRFDIFAMTVDTHAEVVEEIAGCLPDLRTFLDNVHEAALSEYVLAGEHAGPRWLHDLEARLTEVEPLWREIQKTAVTELLHRANVLAHRLHPVLSKESR